MSIIALDSVSKSFGALKVADAITFEVRAGEALGIIGPNGAGKSSLFNLITGNLAADSGSIRFLDEDVTRQSAMQRCLKVTREVWRNVFIQLNCQRVLLEGLILKPNMVLPGLSCATQATVDEVADATVNCLRETVPAAVPGIAFLSGGQPCALATARLNAMNRRFKSRAPWALSFSFARALQQPALEIWRGDAANAKAAQQALRHRAQCNRAARRGEWSEASETHAAT